MHYNILKNILFCFCAHLIKCIQIFFLYFWVKSNKYLYRIHKILLKKINIPDSRLKAIQGGTSKRDLINSLSVAKEDCIARLITDGQNLETAEERELAANPLIRHIAPHLQVRIYYVIKMCDD